MRKFLFLLVHLSALCVFFSPFKWQALVLCLAIYVVRMFGITGGFHRYFSHRSYKTSRFFQFLIAFLGTTAAQKGPLWWAASHRHHHRHSDTEHDLHSPVFKGLWWAHIGWVLSPENDEADLNTVKDLSKFPELRLLERFYYIPPLLLIPFCYFLAVIFPSLKLTGFESIIWGALVSTVLLYHGTFAINSLAHVLGRPRYKTGDHSKNSFLLAIITLGEGWHNNHHRFPGSEQQGFYWWEIDITHMILKFLAFLGIVWDLNSPPEKAYADPKLRVA